MNRFVIFTLATSSLLLSGCTGLAVGAGAAVGVAAVQEGGVSRAVSDAVIQAKINDLWFRYDANMFTKLDLTVNEGRVLITGVVQNPKHRVEAVRLAWQPKGVVQVINEIKVAQSEGIVGFAKDTWITTRLRTAILLDKDVESLNYSIDTVQGTVYLMGFAQNQQELNHVISIARTIENVRRVVSYVKLVGTPVAVAPAGPPVDASYDSQNGGKNQGFVNGYDEPAQGQNQSAAQGGAPVAPVATGEPIDWNSGSEGL